MVIFRHTLQPVVCLVLRLAVQVVVVVLVVVVVARLLLLLFLLLLLLLLLILLLLLLLVLLLVLLVVVLLLLLLLLLRVLVLVLPLSWSFTPKWTSSKAFFHSFFSTDVHVVSFYISVQTHIHRLDLGRLLFITPSDIHHFSTDYSKKKKELMKD